ncbi:divalent-cation tolerance protein CutA [Candidatus Parcubacteria bacterium]|nr:MAG: divalent-cation tolerance protein CutA [Candidatus Parcubacteria bacterium]
MPHLSGKVEASFCGSRVICFWEMKLAFVYSTFPNRTSARRAALHLLRKKLIACANIHKTESSYAWKGKVVNEAEYVLVAKTTSGKFAKVKREIERIHPYEIPCIVRIPADGNEKYLRWARRMVS